MAGDLAYPLQNSLVKHLFRGTPYTAPTTLYVALFTVLPNGNTVPVGGAEVTGNAYARQPIVVSPTASSRMSDPGATGGTTTNLDTITFPVAAPAQWGLIVGAGFYDAASAGTILWVRALATAVQVSANYQFKMNPGDISAALD